MNLEEVLQKLSTTAGCRLVPKLGMPQLPSRLTLPDDLNAFYARYGGAELFFNNDFGFKVVSPSEFVRTNLVVLGNEYYQAHQTTLEADVTNTWYVIARGAGPEECISIDLSAERHGYCYDSFHEIHGRPDCRIIALSFSELLSKLLLSGGEKLFWKVSGFIDYGRAR